jgi:hypothetical protein
MATGQLWLFPPPRTLVDRFGENFFRELPAQPGVYFFCGVDAGALYVGKAKNLRNVSRVIVSPTRKDFPVGSFACSIK